jgi:hypothetical protein
MGKLKKQRKGEVWKAEVGPAVVPNGRDYGAASMRPPASPSCRLYEPEAVGAIGAYAPEGRRKKAESRRQRMEGRRQRTELGMWNQKAECMDIA